MKIEYHVQDADSSSANALAKHFPGANILSFGGHFNRSLKSLEKLKKSKGFSSEKQNHYASVFQIEKLEECVCHCKNNHNYQNCGCISDDFITQSKKTFMGLLINARTDHEKFAHDLEILGKYHSRTTYCTFHETVLCSCGECKDRSNLLCDGKEYHSKCVLHCPYHAMAFEMECLDHARQCKNLIHPTMGKVHANYLESSHSTLIQFRSKYIALKKDHYILSTNLGLLHANMSYMYGKTPGYNWIIELYQNVMRLVTSCTEYSYSRYKHSKH